MDIPFFPTREYHSDGSMPGLDRIFVFGSNLAGRHGNGAALAAARHFGAVEGVGRGRTGNAYAVPTRMQMPNNWIVTRTLEEVTVEIAEFVRYTREHNDLEYFVTSVGCGHAGFTPPEIAPLFREAYNCSFPQVWKLYLNDADHTVFEKYKKSM